jgi:hypothetical protein
LNINGTIADCMQCLHDHLTPPEAAIVRYSRQSQSHEIFALGHTTPSSPPEAATDQSSEAITHNYEFLYSGNLRSPRRRVSFLDTGVEASDGTVPFIGQALPDDH